MVQKKLQLSILILILITFPLYSQPSGWLPQQSGITQDINSIHFEDLNTGYAAGANGKIIKTTNGGAAWFQQISGTTKNLRSIFFVSVMNGWAAGDAGTILKTTNGGTNWIFKSSGVSDNIYSISFPSAVSGWAAGANGRIIKSINSGDLWLIQPSGTTADINSINPISYSECWAVANTGKILHTTTGGNYWQTSIDLGSTCNLNSVYFPSHDTGYISGVYYVNNLKFVFIYKTESAGEWWLYQYSGLTSILNSIYFVNNITGLAAGDSGKIVGTTNGGNTWFAQYSYVTNNLHSISFINSRRGWIAGSGGLILNTVNAGFYDTLLTNRRDLGVMPLVTNASLLKEAKYRVMFRPDSCYNILRSLNNGISYDTMFSGINLSDTGKAIDGLLIRVNKIKPHNTGVIRDPVLSPDSIQTNKFGWEYFPEGNRNLEGSKYLHSQYRPWHSVSMSMSYPAAYTYTNIGSKLKPYELRKIKIVFTGYAIGQTAYRYLVNYPINYQYQDMKQVPFKVFEVDETDGTPAPRQLNCAFLEFPDGSPNGKWEPTLDSLGGKELLYIFGSNYSQIPDTAYTTRNLFLSSQLDIMYVWSAKLKSAGVAYHTNDEFIIYPYTVTRPEIAPGYPLYYEFTSHALIGVKNISQTVPQSYLLMQNYPNPFNPKTTIEFEVKEKGNAVVKVYDILGRITAVLVDEELKPGTYKTDFDGSNFSSGVYFYHLHVNNYSETKKMILIK
jgi:photosystem II stability/assembly factor-like uncharacterized protein